MKAAKLGVDGGVLPTDVLYEVLLRLRAKEVCRRWRSLTSDPVGLDGDLDEVHVLDLSGNIVKRIRVGHGFSTSFFNAQVDLIICVGVDGAKACVLNLATGAVIRLPEQEQIMSSKKDVFVPPPGFVLGHVPTTGVYKVLCLNYRIESPNQKICGQACSVLTLNDDSGRWRARPDAPALRGACSSPCSSDSWCRLFLSDDMGRTGHHHSLVRLCGRGVDGSRGRYWPLMLIARSWCWPH
jgi:hypothetical protein